MDAKRRAFYDYFSTIIEPWDCPALIAATDGYRVAAILDRNGLRPCRYCLTRSNIVIMASETGVLDTPPSEIVCPNQNSRKFRCRPNVRNGFAERTAVPIVTKIITETVTSPLSDGWQLTAVV